MLKYKNDVKNRLKHYRKFHTSKDQKIHGKIHHPNCEQSKYLDPRGIRLHILSEKPEFCTSDKLMLEVIIIQVS